MAEESKTEKFLAMWDMTGLECVFNITEWEKRSLWATLKGETKFENVPNLKMMMLRARVNAQRCYEIYLFEATDLSVEDIKQAFKETPQFMANFIRENGTKLYSDRSETNRQVIY